DIHLELAGNDDRVVDRLGAVVARRDAGLVLDEAEDRAVGALPEVEALVPGARAHRIRDDLVAGDDRAALLVVIGDHPAPAKRHRFAPAMISAAMRCASLAAGMPQYMVS